MFPSRQTFFVELADLIEAKTTKIVYAYQNVSFWFMYIRPGGDECMVGIEKYKSRVAI